MDIDGSNLQRLTNHRDDDSNPDWSPDGAYITFTSDRNGNPDIYVMNADGSDQHPLTNTPTYEWAAVWSPDGRWIMFRSGTRQTGDVLMCLGFPRHHHHIGVV
jgi:TolB protein